MTFQTLSDTELAQVIGGLSSPDLADDSYRTLKDIANGGCGCGGGH